MPDQPAPGTRSTCQRCGRTVWLRKIGVTGSMSAPPTATVYGWAARKGSRPIPLHCPDGQRHTVEGYEREYFGPAGRGWD